MQKPDVVLVVEPKPKLLLVAQKRCSNPTLQFVGCETLARAMDFLQHNSAVMILCDATQVLKQSSQVLSFFRIKQPWCLRLIIDMGNSEVDTDTYALFDPHETLSRPLKVQAFEEIISRAFSHASGYLKTKNPTPNMLNGSQDSSGRALSRARTGMLHTLVTSLYSVVQYHPIFGGSVCRDVVSLSSLLCQQLKMTPQKIRLTIISAKLCFVGAMHVSQDILRKPLRELTNAEKNYLKEYWSVAINTIFPDIFQSSSLIKHIVSSQFERYDGSGFPGEYSGNRLALESQVIGFARDCVMRRHGLSTGEMMAWSQVVAYAKANGKRKYQAVLVRALIQLYKANALKSDLSSGNVKECIRPGAKLKRSLYNKQFQRVVAAQQPLSAQGVEALNRLEQRQLLGFIEVEEKR